MVADTPAHSQLPTELGVVHFGLASRTGFFSKILFMHWRKKTRKLFQVLSNFFHIPVVNCFVVAKAVRTFQGEQKRKRH